MTQTFNNLYERATKNQNFNNLIDIITSTNNILLAYRELKTKLGSKFPGCDRVTIKDLEELSNDEFLYEVRKRFNHYRPKKVKRKVRHKPNGDKKPIGIPSMWDRIIQQCILQVLEPICEAKFYSRSYGFRPNRSTEHALAEAISKINHNNMYYAVKIDIKDFFDNINHSKLIKQLWSLGIRDKKLLAILKEMLKAPIQLENKKTIKPTSGTPQGGILSPLLANICLNEFDWWVATQWEIFKPKHWNPKIIENGPSTHAKVRYAITKQGARLKPMVLVRYADDIIIFTDNEKNAHKILAACQDWIQTRLSLKISPEKSTIVNLKKNSIEFLDFTIKAIKKGKSKKRGQSGNKYVAETHVSPKAIAQIKRSLHKQIKRIQKSQNSQKCIQEIGKYNSMVIAIHNYYKIATQVNADLNALAMDIERRQYNRFPKAPPNAEKTNGFTKHGNYEGNDRGYNPYLQSKMIRYLMKYPILPIGYVQTRNPMRKNKAINKYTAQGRKLIHKSLPDITESELRYLRENPIINERATIEYNDNRISKYVAQKGKCAVTGVKLDVTNMHCHHKNPWILTKDDSYDNLTLILPEVHKLIHATNKNTINKYMAMLQLTTSQVTKVNKLRKLVGNDKI